jgi:hypothetical protein
MKNKVTKEVETVRKQSLTPTYFCEKHRHLLRRDEQPAQW